MALEPNYATNMCDLPFLMSAKDVQRLGVGRDRAREIINRVDVPTITLAYPPCRCGKPPPRAAGDQGAKPDTQSLKRLYHEKEVMSMPTLDTKSPRTYLTEARIKAGYTSRCVASLRVPFSSETQSRHERGEVPLSPEDAIIYADNYETPEILHEYCAACPVGKRTGQSAEKIPLTQAVLQVTHMSAQIKVIVDTLQCIALDGVIDADERGTYDACTAQLMQLRRVIDSLTLCGLAQTKAAASVN